MKISLPATILTTLTIVAVAISPSGVFAQELGQSDELFLTTIPPKTENIKLNPGETKQISIQLRNGSLFTTPIYVEAKDYIISDDGTTPIPLEETQGDKLRWSLANWLEVLPASTELLPGQTASFDVVIKAPEDALPGGHYAMVLFSPNPADPLENLDSQESAPQTAAVISPKVGTLVYVEVSGDIREEAFIRSFKVPTWVEYGPVPLEFRVENLSDIHLTPQAKITITNLLGQTEEVLTVPLQNVFPYSTRAFSAEFDQTWGIGPYTAQLEVSYGSQGKLQVASAMFWMLPYRVMLAVLLIFVVLMTILILVRRYIIHRQDYSSKHIEILEERIRELEDRVKQDQK